MNHGEVAATKRPLQGTKGQEEVHACVATYMQIKFIEQLITIRLALDAVSICLVVIK